MPVTDMAAIVMPGLLGLVAFGWMCGQVFRKGPVTEERPKETLSRVTLRDETTNATTQKHQAVWF